MRRLATAVSCLALAALAACSGPEASAPPEPEESVGATSDSATESSAPDDASTTSAPVDARREDPGVPELPAEAMEDTEKGAEAFVQHYVDLINYTAQYPQNGPLQQLANVACGTCDNLESVVSELLSSNRHYDADNASLHKVEALPSGSGYRVFMASDSPSYRIIDGTGDVASKVEAGERTEVVFKLTFSDDRFLIDWIKSVEG